MAQLTSQQSAVLAENFLELAEAVGNYRMEHWETLSDEERKEMKAYQYSLLNYSDEMSTNAARLVMNDIEDSLDTLRDVTQQIKKDYGKLQKIHKVIHIAAASVALGAAIFSKQPQAIQHSMKNLVSKWKEEEEEAP
jgi:hypothetical protein